MIQTKGDIDFNNFKDVSPHLIIVLGYFYSFCDVNYLTCKITNIKQAFKQSTSTTHPDGRAFDASITGWSHKNVKECVKYMESQINHLGAFSSSDLKQRVIISHNVGLGDHLHFQVKR